MAEIEGHTTATPDITWEWPRRWGAHRPRRFRRTGRCPDSSNLETGVTTQTSNHTMWESSLCSRLCILSGGTLGSLSVCGQDLIAGAPTGPESVKVVCPWSCGGKKRGGQKYVRWIW